MAATHLRIHATRRIFSRTYFDARPLSFVCRSLSRRAKATASPAQTTATTQENWESMHIFFESTHFGSVQHRFGEDLEGALREQRGQELDNLEELLAPGVHLNLDERVEPVDLMYKWARDSSDTIIPRDALLALLSSTHQLLEKKASPLLDLSIPCNGKDPRLIIVGDTHGQLVDVLHIFHTHGEPSESCMYLFNGDVADRGPQAVEILILILAFKIRFPQHVHFLRGNHENRAINERPADLGGGFAQECLTKYGTQIYEAFERIFALLPLFAVVQEKIFVVHGGLFRTPNVTLDRLRQLSCWQQHYPMHMTGDVDAAGLGWSDDEAILFDAQWGDPHPMEGMRPSKRGPAVLDFGKDITKKFLEGNALSLCIRSHQCPSSGRGFAYAHNKQILTVFSASNYGGVLGNRGAVAVLRLQALDSVASPASAKLRLGNIDLQVVEHGFSLESLENSSLVFKKAAIASKISTSRCFDVSQSALGVLLFNREVLCQRCRAADVECNGYVSRGVFVEALASITPDVCWESALGSCVELGPSVDYEMFLGAISARWMYDSAEQAVKLARLMLQREIPVQDLGILFGCKQEAKSQCGGMSGIEQTIKMILPDISQAQLEDLDIVLGITQGDANPDGFAERLMTFAPKLELPEKWMQNTLVHLSESLRAWAQSRDTCLAIWQLFQTHDVEDIGVLTISAMTDALQQILLEVEETYLSGLEDLLVEGPANRTVDVTRLNKLVSAIDFNNTGTVAFFELIRAVAPARGNQAVPDEHVEYKGDDEVVNFVFKYRGALMRGCRFMDVQAAGFLDPSTFVEVANALATTLRIPLTEYQLSRLRGKLGTRNVPYVQALSSFEVMLGKEACRAFST